PIGYRCSSLPFVHMLQNRVSGSQQTKSRELSGMLERTSGIPDCLSRHMGAVHPAFRYRKKPNRYRKKPNRYRKMSNRYRKTPNRYRKKTKDRKSTRLNSSHVKISYAVFCLKKKNTALNHS